MAEPNERFASAISVRNVNTGTDAKFQNLRQGITRSFRANKLLHEEISPAKFLLDVTIVRHERTKDEYLVDEYEAALRYVLTDGSTEREIYNDTITNRYSSDDVLGASAKRAKQKARAETLGRVGAILSASTLEPYDTSRLKFYSLEAISNAEERVAAYVIRENVADFIRVLSKR
ncbi:hypothetical protein L2D14_11470 [Thalassospiraceae bacterium LMO-JJ14]|nr:hypothetical protein L2D14_11470 [Thalassospiraceae bacterium LMO-JJ14]